MIKPDITDNETDKKLRQASEMLSTIYDLNPDAIAITRVTDGKIIDCNQEYLNQIGYSHDEVIGHTSLELNLYSSDDRQAYVDEIQKKGNVTNFEIRVKRKDDVFINVLYSAKFVRFNGELVLLKIGKNISKRKHAEKQIEYQAYLLSQVNDAVFGLDTNFMITYWNKGAEEMYGYTESEALGNNSVELLNPIYASGEREKIIEDLENHGISRTTITTKHKNGTDIIVEQNSTRIMEDNGVTTGYVVVYRDITENKKAEYVLKESENKFRTFFENIMDAVLLTIPDGTILAANPAAEKLFGYKEEEICKIGRNGLIDTEDPNLPIIIKEMAHKGKAKGEITFIKKSGIKFPGEVSTSVFEDGNGNERTSMVIRDITERKHVEKITQNLLESEQQLTEEFQTSNEELQAVTEELRVSNEELMQQREELVHINQALLESERRVNRSQEISHLGGWELDIDTNCLSWSDEVYRIFGLQPQEFDANYDAFLDCIHQEDRASVDEAYTGSIREGRDSYEIEHRVVRKSTGEIRIVHEKCEHFRDNSGKIVRSEGMVHDITERKLAEKALVDSEAKYRSLYSSMSEGVALHEIVYNTLQELVDYIITDINPSYENITGLKREEVIGQKASELYGINKPPYMEIYAHVAETGEPTQFDTYFEPMNKYFNISVTSPEKGKFFTVFEDITERIYREKELEIIINELEHSNKELEQFAYITSHDLREPLRMITSFLQLLKQRYTDELDQDANDFIGFAVDGAKRLDTMTNDLLQYSKITRKKREMVPVNFEHVLKHALTNLKVQIEENNAIITHDPLPTINGDEQLKIQLFQNIIGNAIKYRSKETPKIHISLIKEKNQYLFSIKDNGIGMSPEHLKKIFTIFQRLHTHEEYEGTGIGLAIAQKIIHQQGGQIWVKSELGKGSTFYLTIPIK